MSTVLLPTNDITGNITSCKIETKRISVDKGGAFSVVQVNSFQTYNVCTGVPTNYYTVQNFTPFGIIIIGFSLIMMFAVLMVIAD